MKPFFSYYGGKWRSAPKYPGPMHNTIVEPFAGSAGYSVRWGRSRRIVLCDVDPVICGVWRFLIWSTAEDILALPLLDPGQSVNDLDVCQEARWLIGFNVNSGTTHPCKTLSAWAVNWAHRNPENYWGELRRARIARNVGRISHWEIREGDYREQLADISEATWFVDPPYSTPAGRYYRHSDVDFVSLGDWCRGRSGQVIVCEQEGADWLPFRRFESAKTARNGQRSAEVVWTSGGQSEFLFS